MDYKVVRVMDYDDELRHWGFKKDHKYIARIKDKKGKWRYFYTKKEYRDYLKGEKNLESRKKNKEKKKESIFDRVKNKVGNFLRKNIKEPVKKFLNKCENEIEDGRFWVDENVIAPTRMKMHKYVKKVRLPNGKWRYFYSEDHYKKYLKRLKYQAEEPEFMKHIDEYSPDEYLDDDDNMEKVNPKYSVFSFDYSYNCLLCSTAYELRQRGYDVEAAPANLEIQDYWGLESFFENADVCRVSPSGKVEDLNKYTDNKDRYDDYAEKYFYDPGFWEQSYSADVVEKTIKANNPPNSRGNLMVYWQGGGGHSMVYEIDPKGELIIRDTQRDKVYEFDDISDYVCDVVYVRTDNLKLREEVLQAIE